MSARPHRPRIRATLLAGLLAAGCGRTADPPPTSPIEPPIAPDPAPGIERDIDVHVYTCDDGRRYTVALDDEAALLLLPEKAVRLTHTDAGSGARYAGDGMEFRTLGEEAMLVIDGVEHTGCRSDRAAATWERARIRGVDYRALGNEPGWQLEIINDGPTRFTGDYGASVHEFDTPPPERGDESGEIRYEWTDGPQKITILLQHEPCQDTMADLEYELRARIDVNGRVYEGCGRALGDAPDG